MENPMKSIISDVTEKIQNSTNVKAIFGEPVEKGDVTVIPVSRLAIYGGGGGGSEKRVEKTDENENQEKKNDGGMGLAFITKADPVGFIQIKNNEAVYKEITDHKRIVLAGIGLGAFAVFSLSRLLKRWLKRKH